VQWNGAAQNSESFVLQPIVGTSRIGALGRNVGEVLGVFGTVDATQDRKLPPILRYSSSVNRSNLIDIEESIRKLWSPKWPSDLPPINQTLRAQGKVLFDQHCVRCHAPIERTSELRKVHAEMHAVGTDQTMAANFATHIAKSGSSKDGGTR